MIWLWVAVTVLVAGAVGLAASASYHLGYQDGRADEYELHAIGYPAARHVRRVRRPYDWQQSSGEE
jgi:hypothetical protein